MGTKVEQRAFVADRRRLVAQLYGDGLTATDIANKIGVSTGTVTTYLVDLRLVAPVPELDPMPEPPDRAWPGAGSKLRILMPRAGENLSGSDEDACSFHGYRSPAFLAAVVAEVKSVADLQSSEAEAAEAAMRLLRTLSLRWVWEMAS